MIITLDKTYYARVDSPLLGYMGETESRIITLQGYQTEGADRYILRFSYPDGAQYDVDITDGTYTVQASLLRAVGNVKCQVLAVRSTGTETYEYVKKSNVFIVTIKPSVGGDIPVPTYEETVAVLDKVLAAEIAADECIAARDTAVTAAGTATEKAAAAVDKATEAAKSAEISAENASQTAADRATVETAKADVLSARDTAVSAADTATEKAQTAIDSAATASTAAETAVQASNAAQTARTAAEQAATVAEDNKTTAVNAAQTATQAAQTANNAADVAVSARDTAVAAQADVVAKAQTVATSAAQVAEDKQAVQAVAESIPADYSGLSASVNELKGDLNDLNSEVFGEIIETDVTGEVLNGVVIDTRTGKEKTNFQYSTCTGFIDVSDNADYCYSGKIYNYIGVAGYDLDGNFVAPVLSDTNEVFTDHKLTIPDGVSKIRASSYNPTATSINPLQVVKKAKTSNLVDEVSALNKNKENITIVNHIYVATTGSDTSGDGTLSNPFATIYHANDKITDATEMNQYIIHVADGIYTDLQTRYAGIKTHENYEGVKCKPWVVYEGNVRHPENVVIQWDGKTGYGEDFNYNEHAVHFCPFHITGSNGWTTGHKEIRGFTFDCKNTRYALHVEMSGYGYGVTWEVSDCIFVWHGVPDCSDISYQIPSIGTGSGHYEKGHLLRCKIVNDSGVTDGFRNHDSKWVYGSLLGNLPHIGAEIIIEDCVFNGGDSGDTNITFRTINGNGLVDGYNRFSIINCVGINKLSYSLSGNATKCDWRAEIKCSDIVINQFATENLLQ